jgi:hypothetical protein
MQFITFVSAAAATVATVSATRSAVTLNKGCDKSQPYARIINRCDYTVNLWSVLKGNGCPTAEMVTLKTGESYSENYAMASQTEGGRGVSIKVSKTEECKGNDITQLEYFMDDREQTPKAFQMNYLDVSYVDCLDGDCPSKKEGFYLQVGSKTARIAKVTSDNSWCPILSCHDAISCAKMAYILPDDVQTRTCDFKSSMDLYLCGSEAPSADDDKPVPVVPTSKKVEPVVPTSKEVEYSAPKPTTTAEAVSSVEAYKVIASAVVTPVAEIKDAVSLKVKTNIVYVTKYEYVNAKRAEHAHAHARRHQPFRA